MHLLNEDILQHQSDHTIPLHRNHLSKINDREDLYLIPYYTCGYNVEMWDLKPCNNEVVERSATFMLFQF